MTMKTNSIITLCVLLALALPSKASRVDTVRVYSTAMNKEVPVICIVPDRALQGEDCPTVYLLHGYSDNQGAWLSHKPELRTMADEKGIIVVCPDGSTSWYWDSPRDSSFRYETFISKELVSYVDGRYATVENRGGRAIVGQSMGGHGALWVALHHPDVFGAACSMSGGVDIRPFPKNWEINHRLGEKDAYPEEWERHTVINRMELFKQARLALLIDCGTSDFFYEVNCNLHRRLMENGVEHDFVVHPGNHSWKYWVPTLDFVFLFFEKYFDIKQ